MRIGVIRSHDSETASMYEVRLCANAGQVAGGIPSISEQWVSNRKMAYTALNSMAATDSSGEEIDALLMWEQSFDSIRIEAYYPDGKGDYLLSDISLWIRPEETVMRGASWTWKSLAVAQQHLEIITLLMSLMDLIKPIKPKRR